MKLKNLQDIFRLQRNIPDELKGLKQWVLWKSINRNGKLTKIPYQTNGITAKCNDPTTWGSFDVVYSILEPNHEYDGIGFVFSRNDPYVFIDFDHCIDDDGVINPEVTKWIQKLASYTEKSISGRGIHIILKGDIPTWSGNRKDNVEIYDHDRFAVMTGDVIEPYTTIRDGQSALEELCQSLFGKPPDHKPTQTMLLSDSEIVDKAMKGTNGNKFQKLFIKGDISDYPSPSEADMALVSIISFYTSDKDQIERIMNQSALRRDKWNRRDYMERTIDKAIETKNKIDNLAEEKEEFTKYFDNNGRFIPRLLGDDIASQYPFIYTYGLLYVYIDGVWRPIGDNFIKSLCREKLQNQARINRINEVIAHIKDTHWDEYNLNAHKELINVKNGMLNWQTGELIPHDPSYLSTIQIPVVYDPSADCSMIAEWLETTLRDSELIILALELFGYCLIPDTSMSKAFILTGTGANGKSTFISVLERFIGECNVSKIPLQELAEHRFKRADLFGKLVNVFADLDNKTLESTTYFKTIVSGDKIDAERKNQDPFYFKPFARLVFSANETPRARDRSYAYYRRLCIIPFEQRFEGKNEDKDILSKLTTEENLSALLNQALIGLRRVMQNKGFTQPEKVKQALAEYEKQNDPVKAFVDDMLEFDPVGEIERGELYDAFCRFCTEEGYKEVTRNYFYQRIRAYREIRERKTSQSRFFVGVKYRAL